MQVILLGPPGAGKGTQTQIIAKSYNMSQLSTGDMLRNIAFSGSKLGEQIQQLMASGQLIPDDTIISMVQVYMDKEQDSNGFLFDGFPRTLAQAQSLTDAKISIDHVINIDIADAVIIERLSGRRVHKDSGRTYHVQYNPPKKEGVDDVTGEELMMRKDDSAAAITKRLQIFHKENDQLISYYQQIADNTNLKYTSIDGSASIAAMTASIKKILG